MPSVDSYDASLTSIDFAWPSGITPVERIMLSAHGDLQRLLSAFFARPISIDLVFAQTQPSQMEEALDPSPASPTAQKRQVNLTCAGRVVCTATSSVIISSPKYAKLFLQDGYAIGQIFRKTGDAPEFELLDVGLVGGETETDEGAGGKESVQKMGERKMWRRYTLRVEGFQADIVEVFPDRNMFTRGEEWLNEPIPQPQGLTVPNMNGNCASPEWTPSLSPTETLVSSDEPWGRDFRLSTTTTSTGMMSSSSSSSSSPGSTKDTAWLDSTGGLLRFIAVFVAVLLLLNVPRDESDLSGPSGTLFSRIARLLDVRQVDS